MRRDALEAQLLVVERPRELGRVDGAAFQRRIDVAARDLLRVVGSCVVASAVAGGLIMTWGVESPVPHGGMFVVPLFTHPLLFCLSLAIGTVICGVMLSLWKKPVTERDEEFDELNDQKVKDDEITFTLE